jgi:hypothetical protein
MERRDNVPLACCKVAAVIIVAFLVYYTHDTYIVRAHPCYNIKNTNCTMTCEEIPRRCNISVCDWVNESISNCYMREVDCFNSIVTLNATMISPTYLSREWLITAEYNHVCELAPPIVLRCFYNVTEPVNSLMYYSDSAINPETLLLDRTLIDENEQHNCYKSDAPNDTKNGTQTSGQDKVAVELFVVLIIGMAAFTLIIGFGMAATRG